MISSKLPVKMKRKILSTLERGNKFSAEGGETPAKYTAWVDVVVSIPIGILMRLPEEQKLSELLFQAQEHLDKIVYGHRKAKQAILEKHFHSAKRPTMPLRPLALCGPPGNGKTTLIKYGLAPLMNSRPFSFISLGGATDSNFLLGHSYTYEGLRGAQGR